MGYDFTTRQSTPTDNPRGYDPADHFHLNIWGMDHYRELMIHAGMMSLTEAPGPFPEGIWGEEDEDGELQITDAGWDYLTAKNPADARGLALHKFCSNDPWVTTPEEIAQALAVYDQLTAQELEKLFSDSNWTGDNRAYWQKWIDYLRRARELGGFTTG